MDKAKGGQPYQPTGRTMQPVETLSDMGVSKSQSSRYQQIASVPEADFEQHIAEVKDKGGELTSAGVRRLVKSQRQQDNRDKMAAITPVAVNNIEIRHQDCLDMISQLEDGSVSLLLTDPPYAVTDNDWDVWESRSVYLDFMRQWLIVMRSKMADEFTAFVFCDASMTVDIHQTLGRTGWPILRQAIWHRPNLAKKRSGFMTFLSSYEPFWHCGNRRLNFPDDWGDERFDVQRVTAPQSNHIQDTAVHPTQKPLALFERLVCLGSHPGDLVIDPFCGSGTTAVAAFNNDRRCITSDLMDEYVRIARGRLAQVA